MPTEGPCANPGCTNRENPSGQFTRLSAEFLATGPALHGDSGAHCAKRPCQRWYGKLPAIGQGGAKRAASDSACSSPVTVKVDEVGPRPSTIVSIDEIWSERCVASCLRACPVHR